MDAEILGMPTGRHFQHNFCRLTRQLLCNIQNGVFGCLEHVIYPFRRYTPFENLVFPQPLKQRRFLARLLFGHHELTDHYFFDRLPDFNQLGGSGFRMDFQFAPLGPVICIIMVPDIAQQKALVCFVDDDPNIPVDPDRPEIRILGFFQLVKLHAGVGRVYLQIKGRCF